MKLQSINKKRMVVILVYIIASLFISTKASAVVTTTTRGLYVNDFDNILGNASAENTLLAYVQANGITYLALYDLHLLWNRADQISAFINKAKEGYGVNSIGACGSNTGFFDDVITFNRFSTSKFDVLNLEYEYWNNNPRDFSRYLAILQSMRKLAAANNLEVEAYVGWPTEEEMDELVTRLDRILVHAYVTSPDSAFSYTRTRLGWLAQANIETGIIFSAEAKFMGAWLAENPLVNAEAAFLSDASDAGAMAVSGFMYFDWTKMPNCTATPSVSISPVIQSASPGTNLTYTVSIQNHDSSVCNPRTFALSLSTANGLTGAMALSDVSIAPGASQNVQLVMHSIKFLTNTNALTFRVTASHQSSSSSSASGIYKMLQKHTGPKLNRGHGP